MNRVVMDPMGLLTNFLLIGGITVFLWFWFTFTDHIHGQRSGLEQFLAKALQCIIGFVMVFFWIGLLFTTSYPKVVYGGIFIVAFIPGAIVSFWIYRRRWTQLNG